MNQNNTKLNFIQGGINEDTKVIITQKKYIEPPLCNHHNYLSYLNDHEFPKKSEDNTLTARKNQNEQNQLFFPDLSEEYEDKNSYQLNNINIIKLRRTPAKFIQKYEHNILETSRTSLSQEISQNLNFQIPPKELLFKINHHSNYQKAFDITKEYKQHAIKGRETQNILNSKQTKPTIPRNLLSKKKDRNQIEKRLIDYKRFKTFRKNSNKNSNCQRNKSKIN